MSVNGAATLRPSSHPRQIDDKILEALQNYHTVHIESDQNYNEKLTWCLEHCKSKFRDFAEGSGRAWYFKDEQDALLFAIKWS